jgi:hypothetical protein
MERDGVEYYNSGGWVDSRLTYLTIGEEGVKIHDFNQHDFNEHEYHERLDDRNSGEERSETDSAIAEIADESGLREDVQYASVGR